MAEDITKNDDIYSEKTALERINKTPANKELSNGAKNIIYGKAS